MNPDLVSGDTAVIIGQGNVGLDVSRILLTPLEILKVTRLLWVITHFDNYNGVHYVLVYMYIINFAPPKYMQVCSYSVMLLPSPFDRVQIYVHMQLSH